MEIIFLTSNPGKIDAATHILGEYGIKVIQKKAEIIEPRDPNPKNVSYEKIKQAKRLFDKPIMVHDGGFFVKSLNDFPGTFTNLMLESVGVVGLLKLVKGKERYCRFVECLAFWMPEMKEPKFFDWSIKGSLSEEERGTFKKWHLSKLSTVFIPENQRKTLAEMSEEEYKIFRSSLQNYHFRQLGEWLKERQLKKEKQASLMAQQKRKSEKM